MPPAIQTINKPRDASKGPPGKAARGLPARPPLKICQRAYFSSASAPSIFIPQGPKRPENGTVYRFQRMAGRKALGMRLKAASYINFWP